MIDKNGVPYFEVEYKEAKKIFSPSQIAGTIYKKMLGECTLLLISEMKASMEKIFIPRHTKYVEGYIVLVFPSVRLSFHLCVLLMLTFYVKVLREVFLYFKKWRWPGVSCPTVHLL